MFREPRSGTIGSLPYVALIELGSRTLSLQQYLLFSLYSNTPTLIIRGGRGGHGAHVSKKGRFAPGKGGV